MALSPRISDAWDRRLCDWLLWKSQELRAEYRTADMPAQLSDDMRVDSFMLILRERPTRHIHDALVVWTQGRGTRGAQAAGLSIPIRTLYHRVDTGKALLERMWRHQQNRITRNQKSQTLININICNVAERA